MCVRYTYYCHNCRQCFGVPLVSAFDQKLNKFWYFVCRSPEPENVLVDLLCTDNKHCLRRTEEGARENMGRHPSFNSRCSQLCLARSCYVKAFFMPCRDCFLKDWHSRWGYYNPHLRRVEPNAVPLGCPVERAERAQSEERFRLLAERFRQLTAALQGECFRVRSVTLFKREIRLGWFIQCRKLTGKRGRKRHGK